MPDLRVGVAAFVVGTALLLWSQGVMGAYRRRAGRFAPGVGVTR